MAEAKTPQKLPYKVKVESGKTYFWCSCGLSKRPPFCDGKHKLKAVFKPYKWVAERNEEIWLCGCKQTKTAPLCDGSHAKIEN